MRLAAVILVAMGSASAFAADLGPEDIRAELVGQTIEWWSDGGWLGGALMLLPDGHAEIELTSPKTGHDVGRWSIEGRRLCTVWTALRDGAPICYTIRPAGIGRFVTSGGNVFEVRSAGV